MLVERSEITTKEGSEEDFAAVMRDQGVPLLAGFPGVKWVQFGRGVENPDKFMLLVEWEAMDAHAAYSASPKSGEFRQLIGRYLKGGAMEHFNMS